MNLETERLVVRAFGAADAPFVLALLNDPGFLANIGDRGVRTIADAQAYIRDRYDASMAAYGYAMFHVALKATSEPVGTVGFVRRDGLDGPDIGFSFLAAHTGEGYGYEAAAALLASRPDLRPMLAITAPHNEASAALLRKLGFVEGAPVRIPDHATESRLFRLDG